MNSNLPNVPEAGLTWGTLSLLVLLACNGDSNPATSGVMTPSQRDSGGVHILEYSLGPHDSSAAISWTVAGVPALHAGVAMGDSTQLLAGVSGAALLPDGRIAIGLRGSAQVRLFDASGAFVRNIGRKGSGPGEFRSITGPWLLDANALAVYDVRAHRVSVFDTAGAVMRTTSWVSALQTDSVAALAHIAGFVGGGSALGIAKRAAPRRVGVSRGSVYHVLLDSSGSFGTSIGPRPGSELYVGEPVNGFAPIATPPFAFRSLAAAGPGVFALADNATYDIRIMTPSGDVTTIIRANVPPSLVRDSDFQTLAEEQAAAYGVSVTDRMLQTTREMTVHERLPVLDSMFFGDAGNLWVQEFARPGAESARVSVYTAEGELRGAFRLPTEMTLLSAAGDRIVVLTHDDDGVEMVDVIRLLPVVAGTVE